MPRRFAALLALLASALLVFPAAPAAQQVPVHPAGVGLRVVDRADAPIAGARVVVGSGAEGVSDGGGWVRLPGVRPGRVFVQVTRMGYRPAEFQLEVPLSGGMEVDVELEPAPVAVDGVTAVGRSENETLAAVGFYRRRKSGTGTFLTREDIEKTRVRRASEIFLRVRGVRVVPAGHDGYRLETVRSGVSLSVRGSPAGATRSDMRTGGRGTGPIVCEMLVYLDGVPVQLAGIDDVLVDRLDAIEVYRGAGEVPAEFRVTNAACGVVALWTRARES